MTKVSSSWGVNAPLALSISHEDDADALTQVNDRRHKQGHGTAGRQGRFELGQAQGPHVALEVIHSQRLGGLAQVFEQPHALRKVPYPLGLFGSEARRQKVLYLRRIVKEHNDAVQRARQRAGAVQDALQHRVEVEAFVDPKVGLVQTGQALTQRFYVSNVFVRVLHLRPPSNGRPSNAGRLRDKAQPAIAGSIVPAGDKKLHGNCHRRGVDLHVIVTQLL